MKQLTKLSVTVLLITILAISNLAQQATGSGKAPMTAQADGGGSSVGQISKRTAAKEITLNATSYTNIFEDKLGKIGIGTPTPTSLLTVKGMIETTLGGVKFPDGSVQTTAALSTLIHNATLTGNGTVASPLGISLPLSVSGAAPVPTTASTGVYSVTNTSDSGAAILGISANATGLRGESTASNGVSGNSVNGIGVTGNSSISFGVKGSSFNGIGLYGISQTNFGIEGDSAGNHGVLGFTSSQDAIHAGIVGMAPNGARAGIFFGTVSVTGMLAKGGGSFKIDHPLDPENKYLYHSFVESPDMMNIYNGNITTDANGDATIEMPEYFEALNRDFRYQLTVIGTFAQAMVAEKMKGNRFIIRTNAPNVEVSWQVTGVRHDAFANKNRIPTEEVKSEDERGTYLHPQAFDQPEEKNVVWKQQPELMQRSKEARSRQAQESKQKTQDNNK